MLKYEKKKKEQKDDRMLYGGDNISSSPTVRDQCRAFFSQQHWDFFHKLLRGNISGGFENSWPSFLSLVTQYFSKVDAEMWEHKQFRRIIWTPLFVGKTTGESTLEVNCLFILRPICPAWDLK